MRHHVPALAALACAITACHPQPISQADETAIRDVISGFVSAANAGNVDGMSAGYAADAVVQPPGMPAATGTAAIHKLWADLSASVRVNLQLNVTRVSGQGDVAYAVGTYHLVFTSKDTTQASPPPEDGKWVNVFWRQPDKSWKIVADNWNQNSMPAMAPAATAGPARRAMPSRAPARQR